MESENEENKVSSLDDLNEAQRNRLLQFIEQYGPVWRHQLGHMWWTGDDARAKDGALLRQIRNNFGPVWLTNLPDPRRVKNETPPQ